MKSFFKITIAIPAIVAGLVVAALALAQVTPAGGISRAQLPLKRVGVTVVLTTNGTIKGASGSFASLTVGSCTGCSSGGSGGSSGSGSLGSSTVDPSRLGPLVAWFKADKDVYADAACTTVVSTAGTLACWKDQSGHSADLTQSTAANRPRWYSFRDGILPGINFDGGALEHLSAGTWTHYTNVTACVIFTAPASINGTGMRGGLVGDFDDGNGHGWLVRLGSNNPNASTFGNAVGQFLDGNGFAVNTYPASGSGPSVAPGHVEMVCGGHDQSVTTSRLIYDAHLFTSGSDNMDFGTSALNVGGIGTTANQDYALSGVDLHEVLVWNTNLTANAAVLTSAYTYGRQRWGANNYYAGAGGSSSGGSGTVPDPLTVATLNVTATANVNALNASGPSSLVDIVANNVSDSNETVSGNVQANILITNGAVESVAGATLALIPPANRVVKVQTSGTQPTCNSISAGGFWYQSGVGGGNTHMQVCLCGTLVVPACSWTTIATH